MELSDRVVAITGGARGIGAATARAFRAAGARVAIGDLDPLAENTDAELSRRVDVSDEASFVAFLDAVERELGPLDVLVNNAGVQHLGLFAAETPARTQRQVDVNLHGPLIGSRLATWRMAGRGGQIVNVASVAGAVGFPGGATYSATKHAVVGLSTALRGELAEQGIGVSVVLPGVVQTDLAAGVRTARLVPGVQPEDVASAIVRGVRENRGEIWVPALGRELHRLLAVLPGPGRRALHRLLRMDRVLIDVDVTERARYEDRVAQAS